MSMRQKFFMSTLVSVVLGLALWILVLAVSHSNSKQIDLTENHRFTLAEQSTQAVRGLEVPVKVWAFVEDTSQRQHQEAEDLLTRYRRIDPNKFDFELVDPQRKPSLAKKYQIRQGGSAVVEQKVADKDASGRSERVNTINEDEITNALLKLSRKSESKVYYLSGHGEHPLDGKDPEGMANFKADLAKEGFNLEDLNLVKTPKLPDDCKLLIVSGPTSDPLPGEESRLQDFLKAQGHLLIMLDPETPDSWVKLLKDYGIDSPGQVIIDQASQLFNAEPIFAIGMSYDPAHAITKDFRMQTVFRLARPVDALAGSAQAKQVAKLAQTAPTAFTIPASEVVGKTSLRIPPGANPGTLTLAVAGSYPQAEAPKPGPSPEPKKAETRIVAVGNSAFACNGLLRQAGNRDFSLNLINWLAESENQISIRPRDAETEPLRLTQQDLEWTMLWHILMIPGAVACMGFLTVFLRRR